MRTVKMLTICLLTAAAVMLAVGQEKTAQPSWPQYRGPNRDGVSAEKDWTANWPAEGPKKLWSFNVGMGNSNVAIKGKALYTAGYAKGKTTVWCLEADTGKEVWHYSFDCIAGDVPGPRATPTIDEGRVYTLSQGGDLHCFDAATGKVLWSKSAVDDFNARVPGHCFACSPLVVGDAIYVIMGGNDGVLVAMNKADGKVLWKSLKEAPGYSSPVAYTEFSRDKATMRLAVMTGTALAGVDPKDGKVLWRYPWPVKWANAVAMPVIGYEEPRHVSDLPVTDTLYISSGYEMGSSLLDVKRFERIEQSTALPPGGDWRTSPMMPRTGPATMPSGPPRRGPESQPSTGPKAEFLQPKVVWHTDDFANHYNTCVLWQGHLYGFDGDNARPGLLKCLDFKTGKVLWKQDGMGKGSLMVAGGRLVILSEQGELVIADASPKEFKQLARAKVLDGKCWTMPVLCDGRIYCRNEKGDIVCVDVRNERSKQ